jgi:hypothetical protein
MSPHSAALIDATATAPLGKARRIWKAPHQKAGKIMRPSMPNSSFASRIAKDQHSKAVKQIELELKKAKKIKKQKNTKSRAQ